MANLTDHAASHVVIYSWMSMHLSRADKDQPNIHAHLTSLRNKLQQKQPGKLQHYYTCLNCYLMCTAISYMYIANKKCILLHVWQLNFVISSHKMEIKYLMRSEVITCCFTEETMID